MTLLFSTLVFSICLTPAANSADEDGRCLRIAERHCAGIAEAYGEDSPQYYQCVSVRLNRCLETGR